MKFKKVFFCIAFLAECLLSNAQSWQPLNFISGTNEFKGIEGYVEPTTCNGTQMLLFKFVNNNNYGVKAGWKNMMVTKGESQLYSGAVQDTVTIAANSTIMGKCSGGLSNLRVKFSDFGSDIDNFNYSVAIDFDIVIIP